VLPWVTRFEQRIGKSLILEDDVQVKFNLGVLLRGNVKDVYEALLIAIGRPFMSVNEGRKIVDLNTSSDPRDDVIGAPLNIETNPSGRSSAPPGRRRPDPEPEEEDDEEGDNAAALVHLFAADAARRILGRELKAIASAQARRCARDPEKWGAWVEDFYSKHPREVARILHVPIDLAEAYSASQRDELLEKGVAVVTEWERTVPSRLVDLVLGGEPC
jgi:hypothetical protein